ncbi:hypothetical protein [Sinomonas halotolerans]|uniref:Protein ImuA n=1 Tax=Sinomonas halotolerans TaxID=1644133 RepID=A0ABU9X1W7_9MICC
MSLPALAAHPASPAAQDAARAHRAPLGVVGELQERIHALQGTRGQGASWPVLPALRPLLPRGLRAGAVYSLDAPLSVAMALLAGPSADGQWCAVAGLPAFGTEAAAALGVGLERLVLVPDLGEHWFPAVAALVDVIPLVLAPAPPRLAPSEAARLGSRLRERSATLLVLGPWPQCEARLQARGARWDGLGAGHGHLRRHRIELELLQHGRVRTSALELGAQAPALGRPA